MKFELLTSVFVAGLLSTLLIPSGRVFAGTDFDLDADQENFQSQRSRKGKKYPKYSREKKIRQIGSDFEMQDLTGSYFLDVDFGHSSFVKSTAQNLVFEDCRLAGSDLRGAKFGTLHLEGNVNLTGAIFDDRTSVDQLIFNDLIIDGDSDPESTFEFFFSKDMIKFSKQVLRRKDASFEIQGARVKSVSWDKSTKNGEIILDFYGHRSRILEIRHAILAQIAGAYSGKIDKVRVGVQMVKGKERIVYLLDQKILR